MYIHCVYVPRYIVCLCCLGYVQTAIDMRSNMLFCITHRAHAIISQSIEYMYWQAYVCCFSLIKHTHLRLQTPQLCVVLKELMYSGCHDLDKVKKLKKN